MRDIARRLGSFALVATITNIFTFTVARCLRLFLIWRWETLDEPPTPTTEPSEPLSPPDKQPPPPPGSPDEQPSEPEQPQPEPLPSPDEPRQSVVLHLRLCSRDGGVPISTRSIVVNTESSVEHILRTTRYLFTASGFNERDFELHLVRKGQEKGTVLQPTRTLDTYGIQNEDVIELRRKKVPISVEIHLYKENMMKITVNAADLLVDVVKSICQALDIEHDEELSLAHCNTDDESLQVLWLDTSHSLQHQGVKSEDTLLLRKKFFVLNFDVKEAQQKKGMLLNVLYYQVKDCYLNGYGYSTSDKLPTVSALLHHIEQGEANIKDQEVVKNVVPKGLWGSFEFFRQTVQAYQSESVGELERTEAMGKATYLLAKHSVTTGYFEITFPDDDKRGWLVISPQVIAVCTENQGHMKPFMNWPLDKVRRFQGTGDTFKFKILADWQKVLTPHASLIANYLQDILELIQKKSVQRRLFTQQTLYVPPENESALPIDFFQLESIPEDEPSDSSDDDDDDITHPIKHPKSEEVPVPSQPKRFMPRQDSYQTAILQGLEFGRTPPKPLRSLPTQPSYFQLEFQQVLDDYRLFHIVILEQDIRALLVKLDQTAAHVINKICTTFDIPNPETYNLCMPEGIRVDIQSNRQLFRGSVVGTLKPKLDRNRTLREQYFDLDFKPFILHLRKMDATDTAVAPEDMGNEWPSYELPAVRSQREFYQCWCGVVQGDYPILQDVAVKIAGLLSQIFFPDHEEEESWPPEGLEAKQFLPPMHKKSRGIEKKVEKAHREYYGMSPEEAMKEVVQTCKDAFTYEGLFFPVTHFTNENKGLVLKTKVKKKKIFGINHLGVFDVNPKTGELNFTHRFTDIHSWAPHNPAASDQLFQLDFHYWDQKYIAISPQTPEILALLKIFIEKVRKRAVKEEEEDKSHM